MDFRGEDIIPISMAHIGERYVLGASAPVLNPNWAGPWDCAEFVTWCAYQAYRILLGVRPADPRTGDAYTGFWWEDSLSRGLQISVAEALATPGTLLLRQPRRERIGHIAISLGQSRLVEAAGRALGVVARANTPDRRWDTGVFLPGIAYTAGAAQSYVAPVEILRVVSPYMRGPVVIKVQQALAARGYDPGTIDGIYGEITEAAVIALQSDRGLIVDGEVGPVTAAALRLDWPIALTPGGVAATAVPTLPRMMGTPDAPLQFTFYKRGSQNFAKVMSVPDAEEILPGRDTRYVQGDHNFKGLAHRTDSDLTLIRPYGTYERLKEEAVYGLWAHFIWPTIMAESGGYYARVNSYDRAFFTFGAYQLASHTLGENLAELFRKLLRLDEAKAYFPELVLVDGKVHRQNGGNAPIPLEVEVEAEGFTTTALALHLNSDTTRVDEAELLAAARLVHWTWQSVATRVVQVRVAVSIARRKLLTTHAKVDLSGRSLEQCIWVSDIRHQGRAKYDRIRAALRSANPVTELSQIGDPTRCNVVASCIRRLSDEDIITDKTYEDLWELM